MRVAYFDCFAGISGDMTVGALIDLGLPIEVVRDELAKLPLADYQVSASRTIRQHISATKFEVATEERGVVRTWRNIRELIEGSALDDAIKGSALDIFRRIAEAEAKVHGRSLEQVHFHEVGAIDAIVDVVASVVGIAHLGIGKVYASPVPTGIGMTKTEHGLVPLPAPATLEILTGAPVYSSSIAAELTTPTGAAILMHCATFTDEVPQLTVERVGYGAGARSLEIPNVLRVLVGEEAEAGLETVVLLETNIDDAPPEVLGYTMEALFEAGALDVWFTPIAMKKNRPAVTLSVLVALGREEEAIDTIFKETGTLGIRVAKHVRRIAGREVIWVETHLGRVRVKVGKYKGEIIAVAPEHDDCSKIAMRTGQPLTRVYELAREAARMAIEKG